MSMLITVQTLVITVAILVVIYELKQCIHIKLQNFFLRQLSTFFIGILDGSLSLLNFLLKVDFKKCLVARESLF